LQTSDSRCKEYKRQKRVLTQPWAKPKGQAQTSPKG
jgi:hypothetical protein